MRWLFQAAQGEELDDDEDDEEDDELEEQPIEKPSINLITEKLKNQNIQMEDLVKVLLLEHDEYIDMEEECDQQSNTLFGILRIIISNYKPEDESIIGRIA
jgi:chromatin segregation and condensation protein Rec8/ScpA/Scc1 (kleisin family)